MSSTSATERIKLWNRFGGPVDQDSVKAEFFRKVHSKNPPFRFKVKTAPRERIVVPSMVEYHYQNPPSLLPTLRDVLRCETVYRRGGSYEMIHPDLEGLIDNDLREIQSANGKLRRWSGCKEFGSDNEDHQSVVEIPQQNGDSRKKKSNVEKSKKRAEPKEKSSSSTDDDEEKPEEKRQKLQADELKRVENELKYLDESLIKLLAFQRLQQIILENPILVDRYQEETATKEIREALMKPTQSMLLPSQMLSKDDIERIAKQFASPSASNFGHEQTPSPSGGSSASVNSEKLKQDLQFYQRCNDESRSDEEKAKAIAARLEQPILRSKIRARAVVTPVGDILSGKRFENAPEICSVIINNNRFRL